MLNTMVDDDKVSTDKSPSPELISLMGAAATGMLAFGELWDTVKQKGASEGFDEKALLSLFAPMVKDKFTAAQVRYLMNKEKEQERARDNRAKQKDELKSLRTYAHIPPKKPIEQTTKPPETPPPPPPEEPPEEDPKDLEIQFLKEQVSELQEALKKTEQFKPATKLDVKPFKETGFEFLREMADGNGSFYYDSYGIDLFKTRELPQLKNRGVKVFRRLYFEV